MTLKEGLRATFPGAKRVIRTEIYLKEENKTKIEKDFSIQLSSSYYVRYKVLNQDKILGYAYIDRHVVRSKMESILIAFDEKSNVKRVLTLSFEEPPIYIATKKWLNKLNGQSYQALSMPGMLGSTITAHRIIDAVRRIGPIHKFSLEKY